MSSEADHTTRPGLVALLDEALHRFQTELHERAVVAGYTDIRPGHGCVFGNIDEQGSRLTDLAGRANMTKQSVGEAVTDLERLGYVERAPDPEDGRAKIIQLTDRGREARSVGRRIIAELEQDWAERYGADRVAALRDALEAVGAERFGAVAA